MTVLKAQGPTSKADFDLPKKTSAAKARAKRIFDALCREYPDAHCELDYTNPHELLIATILSAQATDVAVNKATEKRTYMKMGTGGLALGIGAQKYQVIMLFETAEVLDRFITHGWKAEAGATAAAGQKGANVAAEFIDGIAIYQITESGLMASADISGTKYSIHKKLNE